MVIRVVYIIILLFIGSIITLQNLQRSETPKVVTERFFHEYIQCLNLVDHPGGPYKDSTEPAWSICSKDDFYLTDQLKDVIFKSQSQFTGDPLLCAQDIPKSVTYGNEVISGDRATVEMISDYGGSQYKTIVNLIKVNGEWKTDFVQRRFDASDNFPGGLLRCDLLPNEQ